MRATTLGISKVSRAMRAVRMLELSPLVTAATAWVWSMPAAISVSRSKPNPTTVWPPQSVGQAPESVGPFVDDGHRVALSLQPHGQLAADPAASHHDHAQHDGQT